MRIQIGIVSILNLQCSSKSIMGFSAPNGGISSSSVHAKWKIFTLKLCWVLACCEDYHFPHLLALIKKVSAVAWHKNCWVSLEFSPTCAATAALITITALTRSALIPKTYSARNICSESQWEKRTLIVTKNSSSVVDACYRGHVLNNAWK